MSEEEIIQEIEKLELEEEKEKVIKNLLRIVIEGKKDIIQEKEFFLKKKEQEIEELKKDKKALVDNYNIVIGSFISKDRIRNLKEKIGDRLHLVTEDSPIFEKINEFKDEGAYNILEELLEEK